MSTKMPPAAAQPAENLIPCRSAQKQLRTTSDGPRLLQRAEQLGEARLELRLGLVGLQRRDISPIATITSVGFHADRPPLRREIVRREVSFKVANRRHDAGIPRQHGKTGVHQVT